MNKLNVCDLIYVEEQKVNGSNRDVETIVPGVQCSIGEVSINRYNEAQNRDVTLEYVVFIKEHYLNNGKKQLRRIRLNEHLYDIDKITKSRNMRVMLSVFESV